MINFPKKRLQAFVSSTYTDLIEERQAAVEATYWQQAIYRPAWNYLQPEMTHR